MSVQQAYLFQLEDGGSLSIAVHSEIPQYDRICEIIHVRTPLSFVCRPGLSRFLGKSRLCSGRGVCRRFLYSFSGIAGCGWNSRGIARRGEAGNSRLLDQGQHGRRTTTAMVLVSNWGFFIYSKSKWERRVSSIGRGSRRTGYP
jgi:hypothetical protein